MVTLVEKKILLVDDDKDLREALARQFALHEEFRVEHAETGSEALEKSQSARPDLIILDVELPDMDGRDVCKLMRKHKISVPILMLTGQTTDVDTILGFDAGANDYVAKPIKFPVLLARVRGHIRIHEQSDEVAFRFGPYEFRPSAKLLIDEDQQKIRLTEKETDILRYLFRAGGKTVPRDELLQEIWGYNAQVTTHTLETHLYRLRQKLEPNPGAARYLITDQNGYSLQL
jgi:DNA-binding response OmpR family regulator